MTPGNDDDNELKRRYKAARNAVSIACASVRKLVGAVIAHIYFFHWYIKESVRHSLRYGALAFMSLSGLFLLVEVFMHVEGEKYLDVLLEDYPHFRWYFLGCFALAVFILVFHGIAEFREKRAEHAVATALWRLFSIRDTFADGQKFLEFFLPNLLHIFHATAAKGACVWVKDHANPNRLHVPTGYKHPENLTLLEQLEDGKGIARLAFKKPFYVPRTHLPLNIESLSTVPILRFLACPFPHALSFTTGEDPVTGELDFSTIEPVLDQLVPLSPRKFGDFKSFVAAPLVSHDKDVLGVLCIHFDKTDALDQVHIKVAATLAVLIADQMAYYKAGKAAPATAVAPAAPPASAAPPAAPAQTDGATPKLVQ
jgi:hypothetical protein